jgi:hypothetical protein
LYSSMKFAQCAVLFMTAVTKGKKEPAGVPAPISEE